MEGCSESDRDGGLVDLSYDGEEFQVPRELLEDVRENVCERCSSEEGWALVGMMPLIIIIFSPH